MTTNARAAAVALVAAAGLAAPAAHAQTREWTNAAGGPWATAANWSGADVPNSLAESAEISLAGTYAVAVNGVFSISSLALLNPDATLNIDTGRRLTLNADSTNDALIVVNTTASASDSFLSIAADLTLSGTGSIRLNGVGTDATLEGLGRLTQPATHSITGSGFISAPLTNNGLVRAELLAPGRNAITLSTGSKINNADLVAADAAVLALSGVTIDQTGGGTISALGGTTGGLVTLTNTTINSGTLAATAPGRFSTSGVATLTSVTLASGTFNQNAGHTITINGSGLTNHATYDINPAASASDAALNFAASGNLDGTGTLRMRAGTTDSTLASSTGQTITHASTHTIAGVGTIAASIINNGLIRADSDLSTSAASTLALTNNDKTNNNRFEITDASTLNISGVSIDQTAGGTIEALDGPTGGTLQLTNATILGGSITSSGNARTTTNGVATLTSVTLTSGTFDHNAGHTVTIDGSGLTNNAVYNINPTANASDARLNFAASGNLDGSGTVRMRAGSTDAILATSASQIITHASSHTIEGVGTIAASIINNGVIAADNAIATLPAANTLTLSTNAKTNNNLLLARPDSELRISSITITNTNGTIRAEDTGTLFLTNATINGGTVESLASGQLVLSTATLTDLALDATTAITAGTTTTINGTITHDGFLTINPTNSASDASLRITADTTLTGSGEVFLAAASTDSSLAAVPGTAVLTHGPAHTISGRGRISARLVNNGTLSPGNPAGDSTDFLTYTQPLNLAGNSGTGTLLIELAGPATADHDRIVSAGGSTAVVTLGGTLKVVLINAYAPSVGDSFDIISAASITSDFTTLDLPGTASGFTWRTFINPTSYRLVFTCLADLTGDGIIDSGDLADFITAFIASDPDADVTNDGQVDSGDLATFITLFLAGAC